MCLDYKDKIPAGVSEICYKVFTLDNGLLYKNLEGLPNSRPVGKWLEASDFTYNRKNERLSDNNLVMIECFESREVYEAGWHCFVNKNEAYDWFNIQSDGCVIRRVKIDGIICTGTQQCKEGNKRKELEVVVCKRIFILEEE
jgi:hypothetical protein